MSMSVSLVYSMAWGGSSKNGFLGPANQSTPRPSFEAPFKVLESLRGLEKVPTCHRVSESPVRDFIFRRLEGGASERLSILSTHHPYLVNVQLSSCWVFTFGQPSSITCRVDESKV